MKHLLTGLTALLLAVSLTACAAPGGPPPPPGAPASGDEDFSETIGELEEILGPAPANVVGFAAGFRKTAPITGTENAALMKFYREKAKTFITYNLDCPATVTAEDMLNYNPDDENLANTGYAQGNQQWFGRAGFNRYDSLGNLDSALNKTEIAIVSLDKNRKQVSTGAAQSVVSASGFYAYWIISLPDDNLLTGTVFNKGADDRKEPVKKGNLHFKRIGPGPESVDVKVPVKGDGSYESDGELTAGHYKVSFDALDGKGEKLLNDNWLYIPGDTPEKDWLVLVNLTYHILYDCEAYINEIPYKVHMEWMNIPIDWKVASEEALQYGTDASYQGLYCLTYEYFRTEEAQGMASQDADDESETEMTPGYLPHVFKETPAASDGQVLKMLAPPTLSFYRGAPNSKYMEGAYYVDMCYEMMVYAGPQTMAVPFIPGGVYAPEWVSAEAQLKPMFQELARYGRLDADKVSALMEEGIPLESKYTWQDGTTIRLVIQPQE